MRILALDLETSPNVAHVWGLWQQNVSIKQLLESTEVICFGARWLGEKKVTFRSVWDDGKEGMLEEVHRLLDEADAVMGWNSKGFDSKHLMREFLEAGMPPPSPYQELDLMLEVRSRFRFPSNKLDYVAQRLGVGKKVEHEGHSLWIKVLAREPAALKKFREYQIQDVNLLIDLYDKLQPWIKRHPNAALIDGHPNSCPTCGGHNLQSRGYSITNAARYRRFQCQDCAKWVRSSKSEGSSEYRSIA